MASNMTGPKNVTPQRSLPTRDNNAASSGIYEHPGTQGTLKTVAQRSWRPETSAERQDSPLFKRHCKRPTPSSIDTGPSIRSEAPSAFNAQKPELQASSKVDTKVPTPLAAVKMELLSVQPPRTPQGNATDSIFHEGGLSASQRVRMELSAHCGSRAGSGSRSNSSEDIFAAKSPVSDEKMHGPRSCPTSFTDRGGAKTKMSPGRRRQARLSSDSIVSKLLPTRDSVNSMLVYLHELQRSETSLRKQLVTTKKHTEEDLHQSLSKLSELQRTIQQVERERQLAVQKLDEKDQLILELTTKLKEAEAKASPVRTTVGLPSIAEEETTHTTTEPQVSPPNPQIPGSSAEETSVVKAKGLQPIRQSSQTPAPILRPIQVQSVMDEAAQFESLSPRSPNRPLWDPWASGGTTPMKNLPPVFTIGSTGLDPIVTTSQQPTTRDEDHELRSILMSPRQAQGQLEATRNVHSEAEVEGSDTLELQYPASVLHVDSMAPLSPYPQEQGFHQVKSQEATYGPDSHMEASSTEKLSVNTLLQMDPMLHIGVMPPIHESPFEENSPTTRNSGIDEAACHDIQSQDEVQPLAAPFPRNQTTDKKSAGPHITEFSFDSRLPVENGHQHNADDSVTPDESIHTNRLDQVANGEREQILPTESVKSTTTTPKVQPPFPASPVPHSLSEPVSLETLLVDFFTEVDKKRLKMAKVYGKRYEGREKWLFAELSKRYGATKVAALKTRYENGSGSEASATSSSGPSSKMNEHFSKPTGVSKPDQPKGGRQGHPRHPQFFHPPAPANIVDLSAGSTSVPPPVAVSQGSDTPIVPPAPEAEGPGTTAVSSDKTSRGQAARVSPRQRRSVGSIPPLATAPPSTPDPQATGEGVDVPTVSSSGPPMMTNTRPSLPLEEPARHVNKHPPPPPFQARRENTRLNNINNENTEPVGLRQRHNAPRSSSQDQKTADAERPAVSLEGLLKELYKKHQPDKLKNVSIVAKQYAGKERELVGLLKGKYGALSVKHLEENLEVLERAHIARMASKGAGKKRGCVVRTISLVFWVSVVLYFSFGAVFVSVVVLDVWECHSLESDEQELEAEECAPLKKELETFTYEHVADYVSQSHPESCFCSEWKARESALFSNLSGDELLNLVKLVPFSPESFGAPWIASVKEQVPSQEFYDSYAKPVVDVSLDIGSSVWSSILELAGYDEASKQESEVVRGVVEDDKEDAPLMDVDGEQDAYSDSLEQTSEDVDNESLFSNIDADQVLTKDSEIEVDAGSAELPDTLVQVPVEEEIPVEEETVEVGEELQIDEVEVAGLDVVSAKDFAAVEEPAVAEEQIFSSVEDVASVAEESATVDEENVLSVEDSMPEQEYITVGNSPVVSTPEDEEVGPDNVPGVEESELVDTSEELTETTATETLVEDASVVDDFATVDKEDHFLADDMSKVEEPVVVENDSFTASIIEVDSRVDSLDLVESEDSSDVEESEAVDTSEELSEAADGEATEIVVEDDAVVAVIVDNESVEENEDDAEVSVLSEDEVPDEAIDAVEQGHEAVVSEVTDSASVEGSGASVEKNTLLDDVVEVEVRQEGLGLSYPEMDEAKEDSLVEAIDVSSLAVEEASVSVVNSDEDVSPLETEREVVVEWEDVSDDALSESDTVAAVIDSEENFTALSATDVDVAEPGSADVENETVEENFATSGDLGMEASRDLNQKSVFVVEDASSDSMDPSAVDEVQVLEDDDEADIEDVENEDDGSEELDAVIHVEMAAETASDEEETVTSGEDDVNDMVSEDAIVAEMEIEAELLSANSSELLADEESNSVPTEVLETISTKGSTTDAVAENEEDADVGANIKEDESAIIDETETEISELMQEGDSVSESDDEVAEELLENEAEDVEEAAEELVDNADREAADVAEVAEETEAEVASVDGVVSENSDVGNDEADLTTVGEIEAEQSASEVGLINEVADEESVAIEATEVSVDADAVSVDEISEAVDVADSEDVEDTDDTELSVIADVEASDSAGVSGVPSGEDVAVDDTNDPVASDVADDDATAGDEGGPEEEGEETFISAGEDKGAGGLVSVVNDVLARLVEPFEAAKTAMPVVEDEEEV